MCYVNHAFTHMYLIRCFFLSFFSVIMFTDHIKLKLQFDDCTLNSSATTTNVSHAKPVSNTNESYNFNNNEPPATNTDATSYINTREEHQQTTGSEKNVSDFSNVISSATVEAPPSELHNTIENGSEIGENLVKSVKVNYSDQFDANEEHYLLETESWNTAKTWTNQDQKSSLARAAQGELRCSLSFSHIMLHFCLMFCYFFPSSFVLSLILISSNIINSVQ